LREAREKKGVSLKQIASTTRISVMSLEALERGDLSRLPGGIFTRAFVRAYAEEVGLDPDRTTQDFIAELPPEAAAATKHLSTLEDGQRLESDRKAVATAVGLVLVSLPLAGLVIYVGMHRMPGLRPRAAAVASAAAAKPAAPAPARPAAAPAATPDIASASPVVAPAAGGLAMEILPKGDCWVSVTADGERVFSGLIKAGDRRQITAHDEISLNVGDAGAFGYTLNGKEGRPLGAPGEVVSARITLADYRDYITP
jgi:cytoskeleton protein RodZ